MATILPLFLILSSFHRGFAQKRLSNMTQGSSLTTTYTSSLLSPSSVYAFGFYPQGNGYRLAVYIDKFPKKTVIWTSNRDSLPFASNSTLTLTGDGKLIVRAPGNETMFDETLVSIHSASILDSGNFVIYNFNKTMIWQSFDYPTDTILPNQRLEKNMQLVSSASKDDYSSGKFTLVMQDDGNLVQYPVGNILGTAYWATNTNDLGYNNASLNFGEDGRLYILNSSVNVWNVSNGIGYTGNKIFLMRVDVDGIFRTYSHMLDGNGNWSIVWESLWDKCAPNGICGLNAICDVVNEDANCTCLPGFDFVNPRDKSSACERNFTPERCQDKLNMEDFRSTKWKGDPYSQSKIKKEECKKACLDDCNCEVALFDGEWCKKHGLPLRYMKRSSFDISVAFIKTVSPMPTKETKKNSGRNIVFIVSIALVTFSLFILTVSGTFVYKMRAWAYKKVSEKIKFDFDEDMVQRSFSYAELEQITNGFEQEFGRGWFGTVYRGVIQNGKQVVAVKRLERALVEGEKQFQTEIKVIGRTHHRNLVRLIGYCLEGTNRLLVYEYMTNGSLADFLITPEYQPSWEERIAIALDVAKGILYLHEECGTQIIHCDIKPHNILLDDHMCAKLCDFGLAKLLQPNQAKTYTVMRGTRGYLAPEWSRKLPVTTKVDVYSFGIVLLEIICCRRRNSGNCCLPEGLVLEDWAYDCLRANQLMDLLDEEEQATVNMMDLERIVKVGLWCIQGDPTLRPPMRIVVLMLDGRVAVPPPVSPNSPFTLNN